MDESQKRSVNGKDAQSKKVNFCETDEQGILYSDSAETYSEYTFRAIPYCYWNNREKGEMAVWMNKIK